MKKSLALTFCLFSGCLLLAGCTDADWDHVLSYGGVQEAEAPPARQSQPAAPRPTALAETPAASGEPANAAFCRSVAAQDASSNGFDSATQTRVFAQSYAQCLAIYTR